MTAGTAGAFNFQELEPPPDPGPAPRLEDVHARARSIVEAAEARAGQVLEDARQAGYHDGVAAGRADALEELAPAAAALADAVAQQREAAAALADKIESEACGFALRVAEKVVAATIEVEPQRVLDVVRGALRSVLERERVVIQVNPDDLEMVRAAQDNLSASLGGIEHIEIQEERRVGRGGAVLRTAVGEVDARVEEKLERLRQVLAQELAP